jgi:hypothetical protein
VAVRALLVIAPRELKPDHGPSPLSNQLSNQKEVATMTDQTPPDPNPSSQQGLAKYFIAWLLGVPASILLIILLFARGC